MQKKILLVALATAVILLGFLVASLTMEGWNWDPMDFVFAAIMFFGTGTVFVSVTHNADNLPYKAGAALAMAAGFMLVWGNLAVGFIGDDNPANAMYFGVLLIVFLGAVMAHLRPLGLSRTMFTAALGQAVIPAIALAYWPEDFAPGTVRVFMLTAFFVALWVASGLFFRHAAEINQRLHT